MVEHRLERQQKKRHRECLSFKTHPRPWLALDTACCTKWTLVIQACKGVLADTHAEVVFIWAGKHLLVTDMLLRPGSWRFVVFGLSLTLRQLEGHTSVVEMQPHATIMPRLPVAHKRSEWRPVGQDRRPCNLICPAFLPPWVVSPGLILPFWSIPLLFSSIHRRRRARISLQS